jgi:hypothetical protein
MPQLLALWALAMGVWGVSLRDGPTPGIGALAAVTVVPVLVAFVLSLLVQPILVPRYLIGSAVGIYALAGGGLLALVDGVEVARVRRVGRPLLVGVLALSLLGACAVYYASPPTEEWGPAVEHAEQLNDEATAVVLTDDYIQQPVEYYSAGLGTPVGDRAGVEAVREATSGHEKLVVLKSNVNGPILNTISRAGWQRVGHSEFVGVDVLEYRRQGNSSLGSGS